MSKYYVSIPIAGSITIEVEADSAKAAKAVAWEKINENSGDPEDIGDVTWEYMDQIVSGNVCAAPLNEIVVDKARDE